MAQTAISARACDEAGAVAGELGVVAGELEAEAGGLGVDAVAAADGGGVLVLDGPALQGGEEEVEALEEEVGGLGELDGEAGVEHVAAGHALVDEAAVGADALGEPGEEGDDVVAGLALDLVDAVQVGLGYVSRPWRRLGSRMVLCGGFGDGCRRWAIASAARASISNHMRKRFSGAQMAAHGGAGVARNHFFVR